MTQKVIKSEYIMRLICYNFIIIPKLGYFELSCGGIVIMSFLTEKKFKSINEFTRDAKKGNLKLRKTVFSKDKAKKIPEGIAVLTAIVAATGQLINVTKNLVEDVSSSVKSQNKIKDHGNDFPELK